MHCIIVIEVTFEKNNKNNVFLTLSFPFHEYRLLRNVLTFAYIKLNIYHLKVLKTLFGVRNKSFFWLEESCLAYNSSKSDFEVQTVSNEYHCNFLCPHMLTKCTSRRPTALKSSKLHLILHQVTRSVFKWINKVPYVICNF